MRSMKWVVVGLVAVNAIMGGALLLRHGGLGKLGVEQPAYAQLGNRPSLLIVPGSYKTLGVLYVLDTTKGDLAMLQPDPIGKQVVVVATLNIAKDLAGGK